MKYSNKKKYRDVETVVEIKNHKENIKGKPEVGFIKKITNLLKGKN